MGCHCVVNKERRAVDRKVSYYGRRGYLVNCVKCNLAGVTKIRLKCGSV